MTSYRTKFNWKEAARYYRKLAIEAFDLADKQAELSDQIISELRQQALRPRRNALVSELGPELTRLLKPRRRRRGRPPKARNALAPKREPKRPGRPPKLTRQQERVILENFEDGKAEMSKSLGRTLTDIEYINRYRAELMGESVSAKPEFRIAKKRERNTDYLRKSVSRLRTARRKEQSQIPK